MTPREYMRACGVPDSVEVATSGGAAGAYRLGVAGASVEAASHFTTVSVDDMYMDDDGRVVMTSGRPAIVHVEDDAIAWIARKR